MKEQAGGTKKDDPTYPRAYLSETGHRGWPPMVIAIVRDGDGTEAVLHRKYVKSCDRERGPAATTDCRTPLPRCQKSRVPLRGIERPARRYSDDPPRVARIEREPVS
jgi:hypothetical protein